MSDLVMSLRASAERPGRIMAVWLFCVAAIVFWAVVLQYLTGVPALAVGGVAALLCIAAIPAAGRLAQIVWEEQLDN